MRREQFKYTWLVKLNFLVLALGLVAYAIYYLNSHGVSFEKLGIEESQEIPQPMSAPERTGRLLPSQDSEAPEKSESDEQ